MLILTFMPRLACIPASRVGSHATCRPRSRRCGRGGRGSARRRVGSRVLGRGESVPTIVFHGDRDTTVNPTQWRRCRRYSRLGQRRCGYAPTTVVSRAATLIVAGCMPTPTDARSLNNGWSMVEVMPGLAAAQPAPTPTPRGPTQQGKFDASFSTRGRNSSPRPGDRRSRKAAGPSAIARLLLDRIRRCSRVFKGKTCHRQFRCTSARSFSLNRGPSPTRALSRRPGSTAVA